ncbi:phosphotriesterase-related protein [Larkinella arboricola]|uniref:Phosphotriesterase-related protein n=1 Tax=Larkinella arboricola TaxID=643671 RepID=A0A327WT82_LARAB|nr:phosphotriesterase [Larkinella arboricola]RAJ95580.1 phosphotriesterase-related protein [Larkinella arboricola]
MKRRTFLKASLVAGFGPVLAKKPLVNTVRGPIRASEMGLTLIHEHILVDFIGADKTSPDRWKRPEVVAKMLPYLQSLRNLGVRTLVECTPAYLGRDPLLLKELSEKSGVQMLTNTGYYGASNDKYLPAHARTETADQLADRWVAEFEHGIEGTGIRPAFLKISVNPGPLSELHRKLITAAARTHKRTGLTIYSHTGPYVPAFEQIEVLKQEGVDPAAFVWVHAQGQNMVHYARAIREGAWVSLDGLDRSNVGQYMDNLLLLKENGLLHRTLLSHDAGWYDPDQPGGGGIDRDYTVLFRQLMPELNRKGFTKKDWKQLLIDNPAKALGVKS